jgi:uncharacterized protein YhaN
LECYSPGSSFSEEDLAKGKSLLERRQAELQGTRSALQSFRGQLELVGGTVVREQYDQESEALEGLQLAGLDLELESKATKRLLDVLKATEATHAAHLGRRLGKPVTEMLIDLAGNRYSHVILEPTLHMGNIGAGGGDREWRSLSVGTRDQLATLLRLALAAHLRSVVVLDDQLAQSDLKRLDWFRNRLRASVHDHQHQIIVFTCRPMDYLRAEEMPGSSGRLQSDDGSLTVVNLEQVASRLGD